MNRCRAAPLPLSKDVERSFCPSCGGAIGFRRLRETTLSAGIFDDPGALMFEVGDNHRVCCQERVSRLNISGGWPRHNRFPPGRDEEL